MTGGPFRKWITYSQVRFSFRRRLQVAATSLLLLTVGYLFGYGFDQRLVTKPIGDSRHNPDWPYCEDFWFSPAGELIGVFRPDNDPFSDVAVFRWAGTESESRTLLLSEMLSKISSQPERPPIALPTEPAFDTDASAVALYRGGSIYTLKNSNDIPARLYSETPAAMTFTDDGVLATAFPDGSIRFSNGPRVLGTISTNLENPTVIKSFGKFLGMVAASSSSLVTVDAQTPSPAKKLQGYPLSSAENFAFTVSRQGRVAVSTGRSEIYVNEQIGGDIRLPLPTPGPVHTMAFYDDETLLVGGAFPGIYRISQNRKPERVVDVAESVAKLAVSSTRLAFLTRDGARVRWISHGTMLALNGRGQIAVGVLAVLLAALGLTFVIGSKREPRTDSTLQDGPRDSRFPNDVPGELIDACVAGECVLFAGAGVGAQVGLPVWREFVSGLLTWAQESQFITEAEAATFFGEIRAGGADFVADIIVNRLRTGSKLQSPPQELLTQYLQTVFSKPAPPSDLHLLLKRLHPCAVLTTNFDNQLERLYATPPNQVYTPKDTEPLLTALTKRDFFILKLYGALDQPDTVMVAPVQYEEAITGNRMFSQFMQTLFLSRTLLFVGASLDGIDSYLRGISLPREISRRHFALIPVGDGAWRAQADVLERRYGIHVLPYTPVQDHKALNDFLEKLADQITINTDRGKTRTPSWLKRLTLKNIGPFDDLSVEFDSNRQIFLGDNGVGKSTILKAIALGLCGAKAEPYAWRLLGSGKDSGQIVLETNNKTRYVTDIKRGKTADEAEISSTTAPPLEAEGWLAIGFPPLRTTTWEVIKGPDGDEPKPTKLRPGADDLLPLLKGDVDPRLDKLKQWIVNLDYENIKNRKSTVDVANPRTDPVKQLFRLISAMTEGMTLHYKGVEPRTKRVIIQTDNERDIPLEALSQGTISLIGWVGILIQRMYEVFDRDVDPTKRHALILMDEIDAHMHPLWQRTLINHLKELFPAVQFIATTHSPLLVGGLPVKQVMRLARDKKGRVVEVPLAPDMTLGYTDQVLTSLLFGLPTTLDDTTEKKMKRYYELAEMQDRGEHEQEYETLRQELMARVPPPAPSYQERRKDQLSQAEMLEQLGQQLNQNSMEGGQLLLDRAAMLRTQLEGERE
jgi:predicted ATPase